MPFHPGEPELNSHNTYKDLRGERKVIRKFFVVLPVSEQTRPMDYCCYLLWIPSYIHIHDIIEHLQCEGVVISPGIHIQGALLLLLFLLACILSACLSVYHVLPFEILI